MDPLGGEQVDEREQLPLVGQVAGFEGHLERCAFRLAEAGDG
jgi:hypothetical protein